MSDRLGPYELLGSLGAGGMGQVYRVRHLQLGGEYALKTIGLTEDPESVERARREGQAMAELSGHRNVVTVHSQFEDRGKLCLVMELCPGGDLSQRLQKGPFAPNVAAATICALAAGLAAAHEAGILHRDLKPANVLFSADGTPKLTDFGIARVADRQSLTQSGALLGTPSYMSPEQAEGLRADVRADVYGLGAVLYEMLSGHPPFGPGPVLSVLSAVVGTPPRPLPASVPSAIRAACLGALAKDPADRPQSALEFAAQLAGRGTRAGAKRVLPLVLAVALLGLLGAFAGGVFGEAASEESPTSLASSSRPDETPTPTPEPTPSPSLRPTPGVNLRRRDPWALPPIRWPRRATKRGLTSGELRGVARTLARYPTLAPIAWSARGLRTHAVPGFDKDSDLRKPRKPLRQHLIRCFQALERRPERNSVVKAIVIGLQDRHLFVPARIPHQPVLSEWLVLHSASLGWGDPLERLKAVYLQDSRAPTSELLRVAATFGEGEALPGDWETLGRRAKALGSETGPPSGLPRRTQGAQSNRARVLRALGDLSTRCWDLLVIVETASLPGELRGGVRNASDHHMAEDAFVAARLALQGNLRELRNFAMHLVDGSGGLMKSEITGRLLLYLIAEEGTKDLGHTYCNLGRGPTSETVSKMGKVEYTPEQLAFFVLAGKHRKAKAPLEQFGINYPTSPIPTVPEARALYFEAISGDLADAGLLGGSAPAYGEPPGLPPAATPGSRPSGNATSRHLHAWVPHSLTLRVLAREAARLPPMKPGERREVGKALRDGDPMAAVHFMRASLEGDGFAVRNFVQTLGKASPPDPVLHVRLALAVARLGQPRVLRPGLPLKDLDLKWAPGRLKEVETAINRAWWPADKLHGLERIGQKDAPTMEEAWEVLQTLEAELAKLPRPRLRDWDGPIFVPGDPKERVRTGMARLALRSQVVSDLRDFALGPLSHNDAEVQKVMRAALKGDAPAALDLASRWAKLGRLAVARAVLQIALEGLPRRPCIAVTETEQQIDVGGPWPDAVQLRQGRMGGVRVLFCEHFEVEPLLA
ncbi:MAG: serine/threonine protein kinase [Planctomycetes bacterium]|nr:serine/threonine protein kinase [Planctomycetota bacterium]